MKPVALRLLRNGDFARLWLTGAISGTLRWLEVLAIGIYTVELTSSPLLVAMMLFARTLPGALFGAVIGTLASRYDRRRLLLFGLIMLILNASVLAVLAFTDAISLWMIALGAFVSGLAWSLEHPVRRTLLGDLVSVDRLPIAMSLDQVTFNTTRFLGPVCGGLIYAALGLTGVYGVGILGFLLAYSLVVGTTRQHKSSQSTAHSSYFSSVVEGMRYARREPILQAVFVVTLVMNFLGFSYASMVPVIGHDVLHLTATQTGLLQSMEGVGASLGAIALALGVLLVRLSAAQLFFAGAVLFLLGVFLFSLSHQHGLSLFALLMAGPGLAAFGAMQSTLLLRHSDAQHRTRIMGLLVMCIGIAPFGVIAMGILASVAGPSHALMISSGLGLVLLVVAGYRWPVLLSPG